MFTIIGWVTSRIFRADGLEVSPPRLGGATLKNQKDMGPIIAIVAPLLIVVVWVSYLSFKRNRSPRLLTPDEALILEAVREVYGDHITSEAIKYSRGGAVLALTLRDEEEASVDIYLSHLAAEYREEGLTLPEIVMILEFHRTSEV